MVNDQLMQTERVLLVSHGFSDVSKKPDLRNAIFAPARSGLSHEGPNIHIRDLIYLLIFPLITSRFEPDVV
jgi:hypothetical protein